MPPSNLSNNSVTSTPKIQPLGWTGLPVCCPVAVAAEVARECRCLMRKDQGAHRSTHKTENPHA